jgi:hypothetical protein
MATDSLTPTRVSPPVTASRVAAAASTLFAVSFFLCVASVNVPHKASDAELLRWWQDGANQSAGIISMFCAIGTAVFYMVTIDYLRTLVRASGTGGTNLVQFAHSMAAAFCATMLVSGAIRGVIGSQVKVGDEPLPGVDILRYSTSLNYTLIGSVAMSVLALSMFSASLAVIKTGILARWVGIVGIVCSVIIGAASAATMGQYAIAISFVWAFGLAVAIWKRPAAV